MRGGIVSTGLCLSETRKPASMSDQTALTRPATVQFAMTQLDVLAIQAILVAKSVLVLMASLERAYWPQFTRKQCFSHQAGAVALAGWVGAARPDQRCMKHQQLPCTMVACMASVHCLPSAPVFLVSAVSDQGQ